MWFFIKNLLFFFKNWLWTTRGRETGLNTVIIKVLGVNINLKRGYFEKLGDVVRTEGKGTNECKLQDINVLFTYLIQFIWYNYVTCIFKDTVNTARGAR